MRFLKPSPGVTDQHSLPRRFASVAALLGWFQRVKVAYKLLLISIFFMVPFLVLLSLFLFGINGHLQFAQWEKYGNAYQRPLEDLLDQVPQHWLHARRVLTGDESSVAALADTEVRIDRAFDALAEVDARFGEKLQFTDEGLAKRKREHCRVQTVRDEWQKLKAWRREVGLPESAQQHWHLMATVRAMITHAGDTSNLILDPDLDSYYLMDVTLLALPQMQDRLAMAMAAGEDALSRGPLTEKARCDLSVLAAFLREADLSRVVGSAHTALNEDQNFYGSSESLHRHLPAALAEFQQAAETFIELTQAVADGTTTDPPVKNFLSTGAKARQLSFDLWKIADAELDVLLDRRMDHFRNRRTRSLIWTAVALLAAAALVTVITQSISGPLQQQAAELNASNQALQAEVTERCQAEAALRATEERMRKIVESSVDAIISIDQEGLVTNWSAPAEAMFGWSPSEAEGRSLVTLIIPVQFREAHARGLSRFRATGEAPVLDQRLELTALHRDGHEFPIELVITILRLDGTVSFTGFIRDISQRKRIETELRNALEAADAANKAKSSFLANMSHEIRTPMNGIIGMSHLLAHTDLCVQQKEYVSTVTESAQLLLRLLNDILDFSKIEAGKLQLECVDFGLSECVAHASQILGLRAAEKGLEIVCRVAPDIPNGLRGDPGRLQQVFVNLLSNAVKFSNRGEIFLDVNAESITPDCVRLHASVQDSGIGIPADKRELVFHPFEQAENSNTRRFGGSGLGLSISRQLVEMMRGQIWFDSEVGRGSTFHFTAECGVSADQDGHETAELDVLRDLPVLVVDDNKTNRRILGELLHRWQMRPVLADSAAAARRALKSAVESQQPIRLILLDHQMPGEDGVQFLESVSSWLDHDYCRIIMLSSSSESMTTERRQKLGVAQLLTKPVSASELLETGLRLFGTRKSIMPSAPVAATPEAPVVPHRILLVEDNEINRRLAVRLLCKRGHQVVTAENGQVALDLLAEQEFDVVLMDMQMPVLDGYDATKAIRQREHQSGGHLPIVAMTAEALKEDRARCLSVGMDDYISKPISPALMYRVVEGFPALCLLSSPIPPPPLNTHTPALCCLQMSDSSEVVP